MYLKLKKSTIALLLLLSTVIYITSCEKKDDLENNTINTEEIKYEYKCKLN